jgi:hypothetical protein
VTEPHPLDIPACLLLTAEQRCASWKRQPPNLNNLTSNDSNPQQARGTFVPT